jgi:hypothetical protein
MKATLDEVPPVTGCVPRYPEANSWVLAVDST